MEQGFVLNLLFNRDLKDADNLIYNGIDDYKLRGILNANTPKEHQDTVFSIKLPEYIKCI